MERRIKGMANNRWRRIAALKKQEKNRNYRKQKTFFSLIKQVMNSIKRIITEIWNHCVKQIKQFADSLRYVPI